MGESLFTSFASLAYFFHSLIKLKNKPPHAAISFVIACKELKIA